MVRVFQGWSLSRCLYAAAVLFVAVAIGVFTLGSAVLSWSRHLVEGDHVTFQGRTMTLPKLWRVSSGQHFTEGLHLDRALFGSFVTHRLIIEAPGNVAPYDERSILAWQSRFLTKAHDGIATRYEPLNLPSALFQFHCVVQRGENFDASELQCRASGLNWTVMYRGGPEGLSEAEHIVRSTE